MSPSLRTMLEDAADDDGHPVRVDLESIKAAGRRATWRRRLAVGGGAAGAAAVVTSIALLVSPGTTPFGPATPPDMPPTPTAAPYEDEIRAALAPVIDVLEARGYVVDGGGTSSGVAAGTSSEDDAALAGSAQAMAFSVMKDGRSGVLVAADFSDVELVEAFGSSDGPAGPCAAWMPALADSSVVEQFQWDACSSEDIHGYHVSTASRAKHPAAIGVTVARVDGSGVSLTLATGGIRDDATSLRASPMTSDELQGAAIEIAERGHVFPIVEPPPPPTDGSTGGGTCAADEPDCESVPAIDARPMLAAIAALGLEAVNVGEGGSAASDGTSTAVSGFLLRGPDGTAGSLAIGVYSDLDAAAQALGYADREPDHAGTPFCAVSPTGRPDARWWQGEREVPACADGGGDVVVTDASGTGVIAATRVRADGSVISVSVSLTPPATISAAYEPLVELPFDEPGIRALLDELDAANPIG